VGGELDHERLMFVDEVGTPTSLAPLYGYSPRGKRAFLQGTENQGQERDSISEHRLRRDGAFYGLGGLY
jgi:hypothetical protein